MKTLTPLSMRPSVNLNQGIKKQKMDFDFRNPGLIKDPRRKQRGIQRIDSLQFS
jgi:hypothetical protein